MPTKMVDVPRRSVLGAAGSIGIAGGLGGVPVASARQRLHAGDVPIDDRPVPLAYSEEKLLENMVNGGVPKDGIPSIDDPQFVDATNAPATLADNDPVFGVVRDGQAKAYPQYILVWHEIVNDEIGGEQVSVTYCPLTGTPQGFVRGSMSLGVSGELINNNLVMFDRGGDTYWPQMLGYGIGGEHSGSFLEEFRVVWSTWADWRETYPETLVLTEDTGYIRDYGQDPYGSYNPLGGYYADDQVFFPLLNSDNRYQPKQQILGARTEDGAIAVTKTALAEHSVIGEPVGDAYYLVVADDRLGSGWFYRSDEPVEVSGTESGYNVDGEGSHAPDELPLESVLTMDSFWFAWAAFFPDTTVLHGAESGSETDEPVTDDDGQPETEDGNNEGKEEESTEDEENDTTAPSGETENGDFSRSADADHEEESDSENANALPGFGVVAGAGSILAGYLGARKLGLIGHDPGDSED